MLSDQTISLLPDFIANQIAAGEVVQRPESIVKEIIENSLDAGAETITVIVKKSGKQSIHVIDNGKGMSKADLLLSIKRHATSKIKTSEDLERIQTLGFRGEALASIAAVSHVEIRTKRREDQHGWKLSAEPLKEEIIEPCQTENGTQVIVKNLFFNVPARRKFLKSDIVEFRHISETMIRFALSRPDIRFIFYDNDTLVFDAPPGNLLERIQSLFGEETSTGLLPIDFSTDDISIQGFIGLPHLAKQSRSGQHFFLNQRAIVSRSLGHAVFQSYEHLIEKQMHPFFVLNLTIDPTKIDVNVHPQKHEVKFEYERGIYNAIHEAVSAVLGKAHIIPEMQFRDQLSQQPFERLSVASIPSGNSSILVNKTTGEMYSPKSFSGSFSQTGIQQNFERQQHITPQHQSAFDHLFSSEQDFPLETTVTVHENNRTIGSMWQLHAKYIFIQSDAGMMMIDQHAAHERILYERAFAALNNQTKQGQTLLFPITVNLMPQDYILFIELKSELESLGFVFEENVNHEITINAVPFDIAAGAEHLALQDILEQYREYDIVKPQSMRHNLAASMGCKAAIKAGHTLNAQEMQALVEDLFACSMPSVCPHGRPIILEMQLQELDRRFGRT